MASINTSFVTRVVTLTIKPEKLDEALAEGAKFAKVVEDNEPGCIMFTVSKTKPIMGEGPEQVVMAMVFKDQAAADAHEETEHVKAYRKDSQAKQAEWLSAPPDARSVQTTGGFTMRQ